MRDVESEGLPVRAALQASGLFLDMRDIGAEDLKDPFMAETVRRVGGRQAVMQIPAASIAGAQAGAAPAGIIFHVSRCGSTLASQLLKLHPGTVVYAEPQPINEILVPPHKFGRGAYVGALRVLGAAFARHAKRPYVLKLSSWNTLFCDLVAEAFPATPWVFIVRDPVEVCVSLLEHRPGWLRDALTPAHPFAGIVDPERAASSLDVYYARVLGAFCGMVGRLDRRRGKVVQYPSMPDAVWKTIAPHFGLSVDERMAARMAEGAQTYSKSRTDVPSAFVPDGERKRAVAPLELRQAVDQFAGPAFARLTGR